MSAPKTLDEIPWDPPVAGQEEIWPARSRACKHPKAKRTSFPARLDLPAMEVCDRTKGGCGHEFDPAKQRRGRAVRKYGKKEELADARALGFEPRGTSRDPEDSGGARDPAVVQSKTGPAYYPRKAWIDELEALARVAAGRPRILVCTPKLGRGRKRAKVAIMYLDELIELAGLGPEGGTD